MHGRFNGQGANLPSRSSPASTSASASVSASASASQSSFFSTRALRLQTEEQDLASRPSHRTASIANEADPIIQPVEGSRSNRGRARAGTLPSSWNDATLIVPQPSPIDSRPLFSHLPRGSDSNSKNEAPRDFTGYGLASHVSNLNDAASSSSQRLRSGSLTLPTANLGDAFGPSFFSSRWQPTRSGLSNMTSATPEEDSNSPSHANDAAGPRFSFGGSDTLEFLGLSGADRRESIEHLSASSHASHVMGQASSTDYGFADADIDLASAHLRNRSSTLGVQQLRPRLNNGDGRARSSSFLPSFAFSAAPSSSESAPQSGSNSLGGTHSGHVSGSQSPYAGNAPQASLLNTALHNRLHQYSATQSPQGTGFSERATANASRPRATSMGVLDHPHSRAPTVDQYRVPPSFDLPAAQSGFDASPISPGLVGHPYLQASSAGLSPHQEPPSDLSALLASGRNRAGTIAAFSGPGGRARAEQELLRMTQMQHEASLARDVQLRSSSSNANEASFNIDTHASSRPQQQRVAQRSGTSSPYAQPTRTLWIGHLRHTVTTTDLMHTFAAYGAVETIRLVPDKCCAFINYLDVNDAIRAREDFLGRLNSRLGLGTIGPEGQVRVGFGNPESTPNAGMGVFAPLTANGGASFDGTDGEALGGETGNQEPSRALWIGSIPATISIETLVSVFAPFGSIESVRVLASKSCAFINYERIDDAVAARKSINGRDVLGTEVGPVRIGFAKVPGKGPESYFGALDPGTVEFQAAIDALAALAGAAPGTYVDGHAGHTFEDLRYGPSQHLLPNAPGSHGLARYPSADSARPVPSNAAGRSSGFPQHSSSNSIVPSSDKGGVPLPAEMKPNATVNDLQMLMRELDEADPSVDADVARIARHRPPVAYFARIPPVPELPPSRRFDNNRLKEVRKRLETPNCLPSDADAVARDYLHCVVDLSSDFIGNTLVQKFFERCSEPMKKTMLELIAPHLAMIGVHKNGTWAAQKIIDCTHADDQRAIIAQHIRPYVPPLLLDQFGNYVVQRLIPFGSPHNDFIFEAMVDRCWEVAQGRFGARSMRACLESPRVPKYHIKEVALAIVLNSVPLATSQNGALLIAWLLDASALPGRFRLLAPRFAPHLANLCTHKLASQTLLRIVSQKEDPEAARQLLRVLFGGERLQLLEEILVDQVHGSQFITKLFAEAAALEGAERQRCSDEVKALLIKHNLIHMPPYRPLAVEMGLLPAMTSNNRNGAAYGQANIHNNSGGYDSTAIERQMATLNISASTSNLTRGQPGSEFDWTHPAAAMTQDTAYDAYHPLHQHLYQAQTHAQPQHRQPPQQQHRSTHGTRAYF
ncbi:Protein JSN1 [Pseudozyma hubeiensis]|nr:Protein JSN1 [Pseudozyma hubeiensis]